MTIDLTSVENCIIGYLAIIASTAGTWLLPYAAHILKLHITNKQTTAWDEALHKALSWGVMASEDIIRAKGWDHVDTKNTMVSNGVTYLVKKFPDALKGVGLSTNLDSLQNVQAIQSAMQRILPKVTAEVSASPSTPPTPQQSAAAVPTPSPAPPMPTWAPQRGSGAFLPSMAQPTSADTTASVVVGPAPGNSDHGG